MFLVSNFPQVPIATSNPATDSAAREQQLRPPLPAPEAMAKAAAERALDTERDKAEQIERKGQPQQQSQQQQDDQQDGSPQSYGRESLKSLLAQANPTIERPGRRRRGGDLGQQSAALQLTPDQYQAFGRIIAKFYQGSHQPPPPKELIGST